MLTRLGYYCLSGLLLLSLSAAAAGRGDNTRHSLGLSVGAGGAVQLQRSETYSLHPRLGADAGAELFYSLRHGRLLWEVGAAFDWDRTQQRFDVFTHEMPCYDNDAVPEALFYRYRYTDMLETQQLSWLGGQTRIGLHLTDTWYGMVGLKVATPMAGSYTNRARLTTDGVYPTDIEPHGNDASYAFYTDLTVTSGGRYTQHPILLSPTLELGGEFALGATLSLRAALYGEYGIPLATGATADALPSYTVKGVTDPCNQTKAEVESAMQMRSLMTYSEGSGVWQRLRFGLRLTLLIHPSTPHRCNCLDQTPLKRRTGGTLHMDQYRVRKQDKDGF